jgi:hypothetical protein
VTTLGGPTVERCPNCGAPLNLDPGDLCHWCGAHVTQAPAASGSPQAQLSVYFEQLLQRNPLDDEPGDIQLLLPAMSILISLSALGRDTAVSNWVANWELKEQIPELTGSVRKAAQRVQLLAMAQKGYDEFADHSRMYTAEEWWVFRLGFDFVAMLASLAGVDPMTAGRELAGVRDELKSNHHWYKKAAKDAKQPPPSLSDLRAAIPMA